MSSESLSTWLRSVTLTSPFYRELDILIRTTTLPAIIDSLKSTGRFYALTWIRGTAPRKTHPFWDSDVYKTMEACCYYLIRQDDPSMRADVEEIVGYIKKAQWEDGYINSYFTLNDPERRFTNLRDMHELYCLGHLAEFAAAYYALTGSHELIDVVRRMTELVRKVVLPKGGYPGHEELELGLMRLYEVTHEDIFLETAAFFIRERGKADENGETYYDREAIARGADPYDHLGSEMKACFRHPRDYAYMQAHAPLVDQTSIEGHCVRAMYYLTGAAHYALVKPSEAQDIVEAVNRLFANTIHQKMYITGGLGSIGRSEGFGPDYYLPDLSLGGNCYSESCASFGLIILCERLRRHSLKGIYGDVMERALLNCVLGAVAMDGKQFYYENPLATLAGHPWPRRGWFDVACCPPNIAKLVGLLPSLAFSTQGSQIAIHLFISTTFTVSINGEQVTVQMQANLPWEGSVKLIIDCQSQVELAIRIPAWAAAGYTSSAHGDVTDGYLYLTTGSSTIDLFFPTEPRFIYAHRETRKDEVAVMRGPLVYCAESPDNEFDLESTFIETRLIEEDGKCDIANIPAVPMLQVQAQVKTLSDPNQPLYSDKKPQCLVETRQVKLLPYFLRMNRGGNGAMRVWLKTLAV